MDVGSVDQILHYKRLLAHSLPIYIIAGPSKNQNIFSTMATLYIQLLKIIDKNFLTSRISLQFISPCYLSGIEATETGIVHTKLRACSDGLLTIPVEPVKRDLIIDLYWKYRYSDGSEWTNVVYCNKTMTGCRALIPELSDGTRVSRGANDQSLTVEHSRQSNRSRDHMQFQFEVALTDCTEPRKRIFKVDFNIVCKSSQIVMVFNVYLLNLL